MTTRTTAASPTQRQRGDRNRPSGKTSGTHTTTRSDGMNTRFVSSPAIVVAGLAGRPSYVATTNDPLAINVLNPTPAASRIGPIGLAGTRTVRNAPMPQNARGIVTKVRTSIGVAAHVVRAKTEARNATAATPHAITLRRLDTRRPAVEEATGRMLAARRSDIVTASTRFQVPEPQAGL